MIERCIADDYRDFSSLGTLFDKKTMLVPFDLPGWTAGLYDAKPRFMNPTTAIVQGEEWWEPRTARARSTPLGLIHGCTAMAAGKSSCPKNPRYLSISPC